MIYRSHWPNIAIPEMAYSDFPVLEIALALSITSHRHHVPETLVALSQCGLRSGWLK